MSAQFFDEHVAITRAGGEHELFRRLRYYSPKLEAAKLPSAPGGVIEMPVGFPHNGYSAPWWGAPLVWRADLRPAAGHDFLCGGNVRGVGRALADEVILEMMGAVGMDWAQKRVIYRATRIGDHLNIGGQGDSAPAVNDDTYDPSPGG